MEWSFIGLFGAGLATFLSPCVLPLAPIFIASFITAQRADKTINRLYPTLYFTSGFTITFLLLGISISAISNIITPMKPILLLIGSIILLFFGFQKIGFFKEYAIFQNLGLKFNNNKIFQKLPSHLSAFIFGLIFGISWTPCVGPILGAVLTFVASQQSSALRGGFMLFIFSLGISVPLIIFALLYDKIKPQFYKLRSWLPHIEFLTGAGLIIFSIMLFKQISIQSYLIKSNSVQSSQNTVTAIDHHNNRITIGELNIKTKKKIHMVFFYTNSCPICHAMESYLPHFEQNNSSEKFQFSKVNIEDKENFNAAEKYNVIAVPTISIFTSEGKELIHLVGYQTEGTLKDAVRRMTKTL